jgi:hypothetical protein
VFLFVKAEYLCYSFFNLGVEILLLYVDRLLVRCRKYFVSLIIIASLVLTSIFSIASILGIGNSFTTVRLTIRVDGFLITNIRGHLVSVPFNIIS